MADVEWKHRSERGGDALGESPPDTSLAKQDPDVADRPWLMGILHYLRIALRRQAQLGAARHHHTPLKSEARPFDRASWPPPPAGTSFAHSIIAKYAQVVLLEDSSPLSNECI